MDHTDNVNETILMPCFQPIHHSPYLFYPINIHGLKSMYPNNFGDPLTVYYVSFIVVSGIHLLSEILTHHWLEG